MGVVSYNSVGGYSTGLTMTAVIDATGNITGVSGSFTGNFSGATGSFSRLLTASAGISAAGGVTLAGTFSGTTGSFSRLTTFNAGLSGHINISETNASGNMYLLMARGTGVTAVFADTTTTPLVYQAALGNLGLKGISLANGNDRLYITPTQITATNTVNPSSAYFYFIAQGGNYFQSLTLSAIGDLNGENSALALSIDPSTRTMTWSDGYYLTGVTSGFFGVNRSPSGMCADYAVEINSPTGKGLQLIYNDYTGAASNWVNMDVSSGGNYTLRPSGGLATVTGTLNVSAGISASGATFSGNVAMTSTSSHTGLASFAGGLSASGGITFASPITSTRMARHTSAAISAVQTASFSPTVAQDGTVFYIDYGGKGMDITLEGLPIGWRAKFLNTNTGNVNFTTATGSVNGYGAINGLGQFMQEAICIATNTYFIA